MTGSHAIRLRPPRTVTMLGRVIDTLDLWRADAALRRRGACRRRRAHGGDDQGNGGCPPRNPDRAGTSPRVRDKGRPPGRSVPASGRGGRCRRGAHRDHVYGPPRPPSGQGGAVGEPPGSREGRPRPRTDVARTTGCRASPRFHASAGPLRPMQRSFTIRNHNGTGGSAGGWMGGHANPEAGLDYCGHPDRGAHGTCPGGGSQACGGGGLRAYLAKPVEPRRVVEEVQRWVGAPQGAGADGASPPPAL